MKQQGKGTETVNQLKDWEVNLRGAGSLSLPRSMLANPSNASFEGAPSEKGENE
jgi:hypothetical protein